MSPTSLQAILLLIFISSAFSVLPLNVSFAEKLNSRLVDLMMNSTTPVNYEYPLLSNLVRLTFHDCAGTGGCNGCVNLKIRENRGLDYSMNYLKEIFLPNDTWSGISPNDISFADLIAFSGLSALKLAISISRAKRIYLPPSLETFPKSFLWGRVDCSTSPDAPEEVDSEFPSPESNHEVAAKFFKEKFGFSYEETVTILGAHSLGQANRENSGYDGSWQGKKAVLNNVYYQVLTNKNIGWKQRFVKSLVSPNNETAGKYQWAQGNSGVRFMLNVDVSNVRDLGNPEYNGKVKSPCGYNINACPYSPGYSISKSYADNITYFLDKFEQVYLKMLNNCGRRKVGDAFEINECDLKPIMDDNEVLKKIEL